MNKLNIVAICAILFSFVSISSHASGTESYGTTYQKPVDRFYEKGKASYYAKDNSGNRVRYCIQNDGELQKVSRKSLKVFAGGDQDKLTSSLVQCDLSSSESVSAIPGEKLPALVYYLNKRYRLKLYDS